VETSQWMCNISRPASSFMKQVMKFVVNAWKHDLSANGKGIICLCSYYKNKLVLEVGEVQSHLINWGFVEKHTV